MKKIYTALLATVGLILMAGVAYVALHGYGKSGSIAECSNIPASQLDSERSQGLILKSGKLLVVRLQQEGNYSVPGGHVDFGESPQQALARELIEEVGIKAKTSGFKYYKTSCEPKNGKTQRVYYYLVESWEDSISLKEEGDKIKWVDFSYESSKKAERSGRINVS